MIGQDLRPNGGRLVRRQMESGPLLTKPDELGIKRFVLGAIPMLPTTARQFAAVELLDSKASRLSPIPRGVLREIQFGVSFDRRRPRLPGDLDAEPPDSLILAE